MPSRSHPTIHPYGVYETTGAPLLIAIQNEREFQKLCSVVLLDPSLPDDPRFATNVARVEHEEEFDEVMNAVFGATQPSTALPSAPEHTLYSQGVLRCGVTPAPIVSRSVVSCSLLATTALF